jgi:DNA repair exonuclease SbcCD nuclease subunit
MTRHSIMTLENRRLQLRVLRGWVWITRDNCPADMVLRAGDVFEQQPGARVLVQAFDEVELLIAGAVGRAHNA